MGNPEVCLFCKSDRLSHPPGAGSALWGAQLAGQVAEVPLVRRRRFGRRWGSSLRSE